MLNTPKLTVLKIPKGVVLFPFKAEKQLTNQSILAVIKNHTILRSTFIGSE